jgi:hypothetical protein
MNKILRPLTVFAIALTSISVNAAPIAPSTNFEDGTLSGWHKGGAAETPMTVGVETNGNHYLRYISNGPDAPEADKRIALIAGNDYRGNYSALGIKSIATRMKNDGPVDLVMHAAFGNELADLRTRFSTAGVTVAADGEWHDVVFSLTDGLHQVSTGGHGKSSAAFSIDEVLGNIASLRFTHGVLGETYLARRGPFEGYNAGEEVVADLWIDDINLSTNVSVVGSDISAVPVPGAVWFFTSAIAGLVVSRKRSV